MIQPSEGALWYVPYQVDVAIQVRTIADELAENLVRDVHKASMRGTNHLVYKVCFGTEVKT